MNWTFFLSVVGVIAVIVLVKRLGQVSRSTAREWLKQGALIVDVRSPEEFQSRHFPGALHLPLGMSEEQVRKELPDLEQALLLHCLSGTRSSIARGKMKRMGYKRVFNLGSYRRAERILRDAGRLDSATVI